MDHELLVAGWQLALALITGIVIGAERQINSREGGKGSKTSVGIRDFSIISIIAFISSYLYPTAPSVWPIAFAGVMLIGIAVFLFESTHRREHTDRARAGITTVLALPTVFLIASLSVFHTQFWLIATLVFVLMIVLELKDQWHHFAESLERQELLDFSVLIAIALIITPLIPHDAVLKVPLYSLSDHALAFQAVSIASFWKVLLMVSFMSFVAHFITKYIRGRNALLLATFFGGLVSSLATIILFMRGLDSEDKVSHAEKKRSLYLAFLSASTGSFFKDMVILFALVPLAFFQKMLLPMVSVFLLMVGLTLHTYSKTSGVENVRITNRPLPIQFITKFTTVFSIVMILMVFVRYYLGSGWLALASFTSGMVSSAAALASLGEAFRFNEASELVMGASILLALAGSIIAKYCTILFRLGAKASSVFLFPIISAAIVGSIAFYTAFF